MDLSNAVWRKARGTTENGGNCVEVASLPETVAIRDSKNPNGPKLFLSHNDFRHLTQILKNL
ncbi:DUF397 domain-containing protein [Actinomadura sp. KC216]|uniref:DUF397 domain-containing protein n=1 Tax=Actinomadura sp. KC216 TaxID=2530370 RepID=UPI001053A5CB|nr:DUF397 domain-containing protein [Actinomadura sp. KC216]TDB90797.1 DUF397 domain-containing protein [Actinomadura sp. KC216]